MRLTRGFPNLGTLSERDASPGDPRVHSPLPAMKSAPLLASVLALSLALAPAMRAQTATQVWVHRSGLPGSSQSYPGGVAVDNARNVVVTGTSGFGGYFSSYTVNMQLATARSCGYRPIMVPAFSVEAAA